MEPLPVNLPDPLHSHYDEMIGRFMEHSHPHDGAHTHYVIDGRTRMVYGPGNFSPRGLPENRSA